MIMSYQMSDPVIRKCSECGKTYETRTVNTETCSPSCARTRKTRLQKERREAEYARRREESARWFAKQRKRRG